MAGLPASATSSHDRGRSPSTASRASLSDNPNVFSDDYAESFNESYADSVAAHSPRQSRSPSPTPVASSSHHDSYIIPFAGVPNLSHTPSARSRNSVYKSTDETADRSRDESRRPSGPPLTTNFNTRQTGPAAIAHRSTSSASSFAGSQSPMSPGEGPSHPYAMYPQGLAMSRTASIASTARPLSLSTSTRAPAHPYGLYTQNVGGENAQHPIPVGFPGAAQNFSRRIGPEGEEQDIIGPDGHTEQLPPYSRYADNVNHKTVAHGGLPVIGEQGAEEISPTSPAISPDDHASPTALRPAMAMTDATDGETTPTHERLNEKTWDEKTRREKWTMKVFGIPLWFLFFMFILIVVVAVICGAILGAVIGSRHAHHRPTKPMWSNNGWQADGTPTPSSGPSSPTTAFLDVTKCSSTPTWATPLQTGTFVVNPGYPAAVNVSGCLQSAQQSAWSCDLHDNTTQVSIARDGANTTIALTPAYAGLEYGVQPPTISASQVQLVQDPNTDESEYAWHFQTFYNKLVILDGADSLMPLDSNRKRSPQMPWSSGTTTFQQQKSEADPDHDFSSNSTAWFCYWNQTFIEVLVYVGNSSAAQYNASLSTSGSAPTYLPGVSAQVSSPVVTSPPATGFPSTPSIGVGPQVVSAPISYSGGYPHPFSSASPSLQGRQASSASTVPSPSPAPQKIKIEERRVPNVGAPPPTCTLMARNQTDGTFHPLIAPNNMIPVVALYEQDPADDPPAGALLRKRDAIPPDACGCQWNSPDGQHP